MGSILGPKRGHFRVYLRSGEDRNPRFSDLGTPIMSRYKYLYTHARAREGPNPRLAPHLGPLFGTPSGTPSAVRDYDIGHPGCSIWDPIWDPI